MFSGVSKGERNRVRTRVRTAMAAQAKLAGRFLGDRPPYGYALIDLGPHLHPARATEGKRLRGLAPDPKTAWVVVRIFTEFIRPRDLQDRRGLTRDGILSPSAYDRKRNSHRTEAAWSKGAVRTILCNLRYTGSQVWNKQRRTEVLIDIDDVSLGHVTA
ncbi:MULTISPECIES: recombinase family protein [Streptomyces]|uniref:recombinase family protein n=1 Tax=Streptomyces TaxID=1883 RepID=UPI00186B03D3|nr:MULTISPECIES: recombinase family protein [Streptomyces]